jgi:hypothetical protein
MNFEGGVAQRASSAAVGRSGCQLKASAAAASTSSPPTVHLSARTIIGTSFAVAASNLSGS